METTTVCWGNMVDGSGFLNMRYYSRIVFTGIVTSTGQEQQSGLTYSGEACFAICN